MATAAPPRRPPRRGVLEPLAPERKWATITVATLLLVPAFWALLAGMVADAADLEAGTPDPAASMALGLALIPFVHIALALGSRQPRVPNAVLRAMGMTLLVGIPVSALAADAVTGVVAGIGAGGICALRADEGHSWKARALSVAAGTLYTYVLVRTVGALVLLPAPIFPFTGIGIADHWSERRHRLGVPAGGKGAPGR